MLLLSNITFITTSESNPVEDLLKKLDSCLNTQEKETANNILLYFMQCATERNQAMANYDKLEKKYLNLFNKEYMYTNIIAGQSILLLLFAYSIYHLMQPTKQQNSTYISPKPKKIELDKVIKEMNKRRY
jgi:hypothetical protein